MGNKYLIACCIALATTFCQGQSIVAPTIGHAGAAFNTGAIKGGFTVGEAAIGTHSQGGHSFYVGYQFILPAGGNSACLLVTNILPDGPGSLREAIACASPGDTVTFDASLPGGFVYLELPTILCDKPVILFSTLPITLRNFNPSNTDDLMLITGPLFIDGVNLNGTSEDAMILKIEPGGSISTEQGEMERTWLKTN